MRTLEDFEEVMLAVEWFVLFHNKPVWLVPTENGYALSVVAPVATSLPYGTAANKYNTELLIVESVRSTVSF